MRWQTIVWTCAAALAVAQVGVGQTDRPKSHDPNEGLVAVGGEEILRIRLPAGNMTVAQRASAVQDRLTTILSDPDLKPSDVIVLPAGGGDYKIQVTGHLLITATKREADFNKTSPRALAETWAKHIRHVLPQVNVKPNPNVTNPPKAGK